MAKATPRAGLLDTRLLLEIHSGLPDAINFGTDLVRVTPLQVSAFSVMVVVAGCQEAADVALLQRLLRSNTVHPITARISRRALRLLESLQPPSPLTADDVIVAATARVHKLPLYTLNPARFAVVTGLTTIQPY